MSHDSYISGLSRRSLLQAGALLIATPGTLLSAVGARAQSTTPKKGGHLVMALSSASSSDHLDPASYTEAYMYNVGFQVFNTLLELGPDGRVVPSLVESWEASNNDASQWVFKLRKGVAFHNGKELTVKDVIYSLNHHRGDDSKSGGKAALAPITEIKEVNPHEFSVVLSAGNVDFPASFLDVHIGITAEGEDFDKGIGTGAFVLEDFQPGIRALTRRNPNYWDPDRANVESVETLAVQDSSAQVAALLSGKVHVIDEILPQTLPLLEKRQDIVVYRTPENLMNCFVMRTDAEPYTNNDLRLALKYAVDREELHKSFLSGTGTIGNDHPIPSWDPFFSKEVPQRVYDPEKAAYHYKKSGFSGPLPLSVSDNGFTGSADAAQLFQASAAKAGIDIVVERVPSDGYWDEIWLKKPFCASNWSVRPTAEFMLSMLLQSGAPWNETGWKNETFDKLLAASRIERDEAKRKQLYHEMQLLIVNEGGELIPFFRDSVCALSNKLRGYVPIPGNGILSGNRYAEKAWFDG